MPFVSQPSKHDCFGLCPGWAAPAHILEGPVISCKWTGRILNPLTRFDRPNPSPAWARCLSLPAFRAVAKHANLKDATDATLPLAF